MTCRQGRPQQNNYDDCGIFAMMFASQMAMTDAAALHFIKAEHTMQYRFYLALCIDLSYIMLSRIYTALYALP